jgi:ketosteroid isomerase-like protein
MRIITGLLILLVTAGCAAATQMDNSWEQDVRAAEQRHLNAFRANDAAAIEALFSDDFLVNSPRYEVIDKGQLMNLVRSGVINTASFTQSIENIRRYGDIAVVMGADTAVFSPPAPNAGRKIARRFTDIWRFQNGQWRFVARHANPVCQPGA